MNSQIKRQFEPGMAGNCDICKRKEWCSHECLNHRRSQVHEFRSRNDRNEIGSYLLDKLDYIRR